MVINRYRTGAIRGEYKVIRHIFDKVQRDKLGYKFPIKCVHARLRGVVDDTHSLWWGLSVLAVARWQEYDASCARAFITQLVFGREEVEDSFWTDTKGAIRGNEAYEGQVCVVFVIIDGAGPEAEALS